MFKSSVGDRIGRIMSRRAHRDDPRKLKHLANLVARANRIANVKPQPYGLPTLKAKNHILRRVK